MKILSNTDKGFSLMEVNLAVFVVAGGLLVLFSLYPLGLKESEMSMADTQEAMFADYVLGAMKGTAASMTNWSEWQTGRFDTDLSGDYIYQAASKNEEPKKLDAFPFVTDIKQTRNPLQYQLVVEDYPLGSGGERKRVILSVKGGKYGRMDATTKCYVTDLYYMGM